VRVASVMESHAGRSNVVELSRHEHRRFPSFIVFLALLLGALLVFRFTVYCWDKYKWVLNGGGQAPTYSQQY
jgi:hypothetical protein